MRQANTNLGLLLGLPVIGTSTREGGRRTSSQSRGGPSTSGEMDKAKDKERDIPPEALEAFCEARTAQVNLEEPQTSQEGDQIQSWTNFETDGNHNRQQIEQN